MDNIEKILERIDEDFFVIKENELQNIEPDFPKDAPPQVIAEIMMELPGQIEHLEIRVVECEASIGELKVLIRAKTKFLEREKSRIRQDYSNLHKKESEQFALTMREIFTEVISSESKVARGTLQEMLKAMKPEKPTKGDLDDIANIQTADLQEEIVSYEEKLNKLEELCGMLKAKVERYENKLAVAKQAAKLLSDEMYRLGATGAAARRPNNQM